MSTVTIQQRVKALYTQQYNLLKEGIDRALLTIHMDRENYIKFSIQVPIPNDLWYVIKDEYFDYGWLLNKDSHQHDVHNVSISHKVL